VFCPPKIIEIKPTAAAVDSLKVFPFLNKQEVIDGLKEELPQYLDKALDLSNEIDLVDWQRRHETVWSKWSAAAHQILLVQPSSAATDCVFSILVW